MRIKNNFKEALAYIGSSKSYIYFTIALFLASAIIGYLFSFYFDEFFRDFLKDIIDKTEGLNTIEMIIFIFRNNFIAALVTLFTGVLVGIIPLFNATTNGLVIGYVLALASEFGMFSSALFRLVPHGIFELPAIVICIALGMKLGFGFLSNYYIFYKKDTRKKLFGAVAILLSIYGLSLAGSSFSGGSSVLESVFLLIFGIVLLLPFGFLFFFNVKLRRKQFSVFHERFSKSLKVFVYVVLPLLIVAAVIEGLLISFGS